MVQTQMLSTHGNPFNYFYLKVSK